MDRQRLFGRLAGGLACFVLLAPSAAPGDDAPPAPWAAAPASGDASVADWASKAFAPSTPAPTQPDANVRPMSHVASPGADRYGAAPTGGAPIASSNPMRSDRPTPNPFPAGNPLRGGDPTTPARPSMDGSQAARDAFAGNLHQPPKAFDEPAPTPSEGRIAVGAMPVPTEAAPEQPDSPTIQIAPEAFAPMAPVERTPVERVADEGAPSEPAPIKVAATPRADWPVEQDSEPTHVASASAYDEPAAFESPFTSTSAPSPMAPASEGVGQPGPSTLEGPQEASLVVEKRGPREARIGQPCRFAVRVRNTGTGAADNVVLTDQVPAGTRLLSTRPTADQTDGQIVWRLGSLQAGDERTVEIELEPLREGPLGSVATVSMDASASAATTCTRPQIALRMTAPPRVLVGGEQIITIELHNPGTGAATGVMLVEDVPPQLRHAAGPSLEYEVGTLQPGETRRVDLHMTAAQAGHVVNAVAAVADGDLRAERSVEFDVVAPSLAVSIDGPKRRYLERPASYTIGIDNPGTAPAKDVRLVTHLPRGMNFVSANNLGEYDETTHSVYWSLAELPEGERGEVEVTAVPTVAGDHVLKVQSEARDGLEAAEAHQVRVEGVAALAFEVRDLSDPIGVGDETIYEIRVLNEGTKAATGVRVRVEAPSGMRVLAGQGQSPCRVEQARAEFAPLPRLEPGQKAAYRVKIAGVEPGDQRVTVLVESDDLSRPIRREESTRVFGDE